VTLPARFAGTLVVLACVGPPDLAAQQPDSTTASDTTKRAEVSAQDTPEDRGLVIRTADGALQLRILGSIRIFG